MLRLLRLHPRFFLGITLAGLALRLFFLVYFPAVTDDSRIYADFATNWLQHGVYGTTQATNIVPSDERLPGYPGFLALLFSLFGVGNFRAVMAVQILLDLGTCFIVADLARRAVSDRAARIAFLLAALCPFLANYASAALTETLEVFFTVLALDCAAAGFDRLEREQVRWGAWAGAGLGVAACILLRPDGGILLVAMGLSLVWTGGKRWRENSSLIPALRAAILVSLFALLPLAPWTVRNLRTLHRFQPLAPRYATEDEAATARGFNRWVRTWIADYASVEEIYWNVPGAQIDPDKLPSRAFDSALQRETTVLLINDYNQSSETTPDLDARFDELARQRIRARPVRYFIGLPALRIADMWLRPRTELLPPDVRWWEFNDELKASITAVVLGLLNLAYVAAALGGAIFRTSRIRYLGLLLGFVLLRSAFLGTLENPEPRYTLECYPVMMVLGAAFLSDWRSRSGRSLRTSQARQS